MTWRVLIFLSARILHLRIISNFSLLAIGLFGLLFACGDSTFLPSKRIDPDKPLAVALLVPYGSPSSSDTIIAHNLENAARMAIKDLRGVEIDLRIYPTKATSETAAQAARQAVDEGAKIILGPVYSKKRQCSGISGER